VLQGWGKSDFSGRMISATFVVVMAAAAAWGVKVLMGTSH
jgi:hypothetical protein